MQRIIFFDGICLLCNRFINFVFKNDNKLHFKGATLQSDTALKLLKKPDLKLGSLVYFENNICYRKSTAIIRVLFQLGGFWSIISILLSAIPQIIRDYIYDFIANNRYHFFGKASHCRLPTENEKKYFLN